MKLYLSKDTNKFITDPAYAAPIESINFKRGDSAKVELIFVSEGIALSATNNKDITLGIKPQGQYDNGGEFLTYANSYTCQGNSYVFNPSFNTVEINSLLNAGGGVVPSINTMFEVEWSDDGGTTVASSNIITAIIYNDLIKGGEATPEPAQTLVSWFEESLIGDTAPVNGVVGSRQRVRIILDQTVTTVAGAATVTINRSGSPIVFSGIEYDDGEATQDIVGLIVQVLNNDPTFGAYASAINYGDVLNGFDVLLNVTAINDPALSVVVEDTWGEVFSISQTTVSTGVAPVTGTITPPYIRVADGFMYIQQSGQWRRAALSAY